MYEEELTAAEHEVEAALRSLRPTPARIDLPAMGQVAAASAAGQRKTPAQTRKWAFATAAAVSAIAGGTWLVLQPRDDLPGRAKSEWPTLQFDFAAADLPSDRPTMVVFRRALAESPAELDALLARQAMTGFGPDDAFRPAGLSPLWNATFPSTRGEM